MVAMRAPLAGDAMLIYVATAPGGTQGGSTAGGVGASNKLSPVSVSPDGSEAVHISSSAAASSSSATSTSGAHLNVLRFWLQQRLCSRDRVERHYSFLIGMLIAATVLFSLIKSQGTVMMW